MAIVYARTASNLTPNGADPRRLTSWGGPKERISSPTMAHAACRGHARSDFSGRDDKNWLQHSLWFKDDSRLEYKPVHVKPLSVESIEPKVRTY